MIPRRYRIIRPFLASFIHPRFNRPPLLEVLGYLLQPNKERRALHYIEQKNDDKEFIKVSFYGIAKPLYYPRAARWIDFCQTVDEVFNAKNWHHFNSDPTPISANDIVVDCGAAEGLFAFYSSQYAHKVYAIEPIPVWHSALIKTFDEISNVEILKLGVGHAIKTMKMTNDEIFSRVSSSGNLEIPISTLDCLFADKGIPVTYLKADIEGFEFPMLLGAENLIRLNRPKISMTMYHHTNHFEQAKEFLLNIHSDYRFQLRGIAENGNPVLMHAY